MSRPFQRIAIVGMGLIGGSIGMALYQGKIAEEVVGCDLNVESLDLALSTKAAHRVEKDIVKAVKDAEMVILATPVRTYPSIVKAMKDHLEVGAIVTDVGSTKSWVVKELETLLGDDNPFVGGHPMAGSEKKGMEGADRYLLENAVYVLTPHDRTCRKALEKVKSMVQALGARSLVLSVEEHDKMVAMVSHLPHMVAVALVDTLGEVTKEHPSVTMLAAGGFRDTTRIAAGDPQMWYDIACTNRNLLVEKIDHFQSLLEKLKREILTCGQTIQGTEEPLKVRLQKARDLRLSIPGKAKGLLPGIHEVIVTVPDRPGMIGHMARLLGDQGINIADIEILRVREGDGGTIRIGFYQAHEAEKALQVLSQDGIIVKRC
ncbi:prephenate dehydrogenase [Heliorestis acidaminivorans]|uniref:Prephenate dehydrogenase n=1 Tax=Heliorestis acidaminivorans TaxID=553427 RepID=A0A6I0EXU3_9FIRM|nr:prephenate dehydrogenase [Heliorestis acidaminivorans]KAB2954629.1 prephenate dehydrogenase [Heliorestis acidaminivorans]